MKRYRSPYTRLSIHWVIIPVDRIELFYFSDTVPNFCSLNLSELRHSGMRHRETAPLGGRLHPGLQHLRPGQLQRGQPASAENPAGKEARRRGRQGPHHHRREQAWLAAPKDGLQRGRQDAGSVGGLRVFWNLGRRDLPRRAFSIPRAAGTHPGV